MFLYIFYLRYLFHVILFFYLVVLFLYEVILYILLVIHQEVGIRILEGILGPRIMGFMKTYE